MEYNRQQTFNIMQRFTFARSFIFLGIFLFLFGGCDKSKVQTTEETNEDSVLVKQDWPIFRGDTELHGESSEDLSYPLEIAWTFTPEVPEGKRAFPIDASPVIADGVVYIGDQSGIFYAIDLQSGKELWRYEAESAISGAAAIFGARVFFGDTGGTFYALNIEEGIEAWTYEVDGKIEGGPNLLHTDDGIVRVFFGSEDTYLYCVNGANGELLWKHETDNQVVATPSIINSADEQAVAFGGCDGVLHIVPVVKSNVDAKAAIEVGSYIANSSSVRDGIAYVAHDGGEVVAVDIAAREVKWLVETGFQYRGCSAAVGKDKLYVPSNSKKLSAYNRENGELVWEFQGRKSFESSPVITDSAIWQAGIDGFLYAIDPESGREKWSWEFGERIKSSPAISAGKLVIASQGGSVYALHTAN